MSPLWSDLALARAALADAVARGLIDDPDHPAGRIRERKRAANDLPEVRRPLRPRLTSFAL